MRRKLALEDALPDLIIGLMGIPVGLSLQTVVSVTLQTGLCSKQQWEGLIYFVLIIMLYGLHSVALYMPFEVGQRLIEQMAFRHRRRRGKETWQRYLVLRTLFSLPCSVLVVGTLAAVGVSFERAMQLRPYVQFLGRSLHPAQLVFLSFAEVNLAFLLMFTAAPLSKFLDEYPVVMRFYIAAMFAGFTISVLGLITFTN